MHVDILVKPGCVMSFTMEAAAKYDFEATADDELSFRKGEKLKILQTTGNWYKAELNGAEGFVPKNFISIHLPSWYQEDASRSDAEEKLMSQPVGAFLIRGSQSAALGDFSISVRHATDVQHFKVLQDGRGQYKLWSEKFPSLNQLVEFYKKNTVSKHTQIFLQETQQQQRGTSDNLPPLPASLHTPPVLDRPCEPAPRQHKASSTRKVKALYSFHAEDTDELEFSVGDIIEVLECSDQAWWRGQLRGRTGLFPSNYTSPI
ncbi:GRB2-related adapter protein-like isoform X3 [Seriola aureovittata]|uniref:GRB2-related adapter protein-like isoform X3 n=2 Tax=Seriola TaxID=8160 RepID=UPI0024BE9CA5|nr:GRB2-related adapter protein-like isoform X3 [Seriola aureovittata]